MITIIDYGMGNIGSIANMFKIIGVNTNITSDPEKIAKADKLILPGIGSFDNGMKNLDSRLLTDILNQRVIKNGVPILGICLGMQLFTKSSQEGKCNGLGWFDAETKAFSFDKNNKNLKVPHMGWNNISLKRSHPVLNDIPADARFYFVHSYHLSCYDKEIIYAETEYGYKFTSIAIKSNIIGVQFHPEKSHKYGMKLLKNFAEKM